MKISEIDDKISDLGLTYSILRNELTLSRRRVMLIKDSMETLENYLNPIRRIGPVKNITCRVQKAHMIQLQIISGIFMLLEDYLVFSHNLRQPLPKFPGLIISENRNIVWNEIHELELISNSNDIRSYLLLPNPQTLQIKKEEKVFVESQLYALSREMYKRIKRIIKFFKDYGRVYAKYKHILPAIIGVHTIEPDRYIISHIYVRDSQKGKSVTYIIPCDNETLNYYKGLLDDIITTFDALLLQRIHHILNCGRPFLPVTNYFLHRNKDSGADLARWNDLVRRVNYVTRPVPNHKIIIPWMGKHMKIANKYFRQNCIYKIEQDLFESSIVGGELGFR
jgi:hypothetical protein